MVHAKNGRVSHVIERFCACRADPGRSQCNWLPGVRRADGDGGMDSSILALYVTSSGCGDVLRQKGKDGVSGLFVYDSGLPGGRTHLGDRESCGASESFSKERGSV